MGDISRFLYETGGLEEVVVERQRGVGEREWWREGEGGGDEMGGAGGGGYRRASEVDRLDSLVHRKVVMTEEIEQLLSLLRQPVWAGLRMDLLEPSRFPALQRLIQQLLLLLPQVCVCVCVYACVCAYMYVCLFVCMYIYTYCVCVCMCV